MYAPFLTEIHERPGKENEMKKAIIAVAAILIAVISGISYAETTASGKLMGIFPDLGKPGVRGELLIKGLPLNSDIYVTGEHFADYFYKTRVQSSFLKLTNNISLGAAAEHVDGTSFAAHQEIGGLVRLVGHPIESVFAKLDVRYWPEIDTLDMYGFVDSTKFFAELLGSYNTETECLMLRPAVDFKVTKNVFIGMEVKITGELKNLDTVYTGLRAGISF